MPAEQPFYQETQIANGPLVITHAMPTAQSVALGIFVDVGSRDESDTQAGITHALEHMLFKGTKQMDVHRLAEKLDALGGNANAFTSRERTCFHLHVLHEHWREALSLLTSMVREPALPEEEWQRERGVIFSEMAMVEDTPEEWVMDQHVEALFPDHALGRPVLGRHDTLNRFSVHNLRTYLQQHYSAGRLLLSAAGHIDHNQLVEAVAALDWQPDSAYNTIRQPPTGFTNGIQALPRADEQAQMIVSFDGITANSDERPQAWLSNQILGGGMSSRLFREIREKRGLAYSVGSHLSMLSDAGIWSMNCGMDPERAADCVTVIRDVLEHFSESISVEEIERCKRQLEVQFRMGLDSVEGQMLYLGGRQDEAALLSPLQWLGRIAEVDVAMLKDWCEIRLSQPGLWSIAAPEQALDKISDRIRA